MRISDFGLMKASLSSTLNPSSNPHSEIRIPKCK